MTFEVIFEDSDKSLIESYTIGVEGQDQMLHLPLVGDFITIRHAEWKVTARSWWKLDSLTIRLEKVK